MNINFKVVIEYKDITRQMFIDILKARFIYVCKTKDSQNINIWKQKYISIDYRSKKKCNCYIDLWNTYLRSDYTLDQLLDTVLNDHYIIRNLK